MKRSNRHSQGFSLPEVLIASTLLFTFATLSVGSYRDHVKHEQINASRASAQAWLEDVSRIAQQFNTHCLLEVNLAAGTCKLAPTIPRPAPSQHRITSSNICGEGTPATTNSCAAKTLKTTPRSNSRHEERRWWAKKSNWAPVASTPNTACW